MRGSPRDARNYELMTVLSPDVPEDEIQGTIERVMDYVASAGGSIVDVSRESPWGRRRLSYPIRHGGRDVRDGFYTLYHFQVAPHLVEDIERELKLNDRIMRYLLTQHTPRPVVETEPTASVEAEVETPTDVEATAAPTDSSEESEPEVAVEVTELEAAVEVTEPDVAAEATETSSTDVAAADAGEDVADADEASPPEEA